MTRPRRLLGFLAVLALSTLLGDLITGGVMIRQTQTTAFGRWLGPTATARLAPGYLTLRSDLVMDTPEGATRDGLRGEALQESQLATLLRSLGTPPNHQAEVRELVDALFAYASLQLGASLCVRSCLPGFGKVNAQGVIVADLASSLYGAAKPKRSRPVFHRP